MKVHGLYRSYETAERLGADSYGELYGVKGDSALAIRIYKTSFCTPMKQKEVSEAITQGGCVDMIYQPKDIVSDRGGFAGYTYVRPRDLSPNMNISQPSVKPKTPVLSGAAEFLIEIVFGIIASAAIYFLIYPAIYEKTGQGLNVRGVPMIIGGWGLMLFGTLKANNFGMFTTGLGILGFIAGAAAVAMLCAMLAILFEAFTALFIALLPTIIVIGVIIVIFRSFMK